MMDVTVPNSNKAPKFYEKYVCTLSDELKRKAKEELREDDIIREQYLRQLRQWIAKHPRIKRCRTDAVFLLRFLRATKFNFPAACKYLEKYLTMRQMHPEWCKNLDIDDPSLDELVNSGICLLLRNEWGPDSPPTLFRTGVNFDPKKHSPRDVQRIYQIVFEILLEDERAQIYGYNIYSDDSNCSIDYFMMYSLSEWRDVIFNWQCVLPIRFKRGIMFNLPEFAIKAINLIMSLFKEKVRQRISVSVKYFLQ